MTTLKRLGELLVGALVTLVSAHAGAQVTKGQCIQANTDAQTFRREGRFAEARKELEMCSSSSCPSLVSADCIKRLDELESAQPTVVFNVVDGAGRDLNEVKVTLDGAVLLDKLEGVAVGVDLGEHTLTFSAPNRPSVSQKLVFRQGEKSRIVRITMEGPHDARPDGEAQPSPSASGQTPTADDPAARGGGSSGSSQRTIGFVVGGIGLAGLGIGGFFGYRAIQAKGRQTDNCQSSTTCPDYAAAADAHEDGESNGLISTIAFLAGGAATAAGVVLVLTAGPKAEGSAPVALRLTPRFGMSGAKLELAGAF
jgi:hypothetical protein